MLVRYPLVKILNEIYFLAKRGPDRITTVPVRAAGRGVPLQQQSQCSFIIFFFLLITIQVIERISASTSQHTNTSVCVSGEIHHLLDLGVNGVE